MMNPTEIKTSLVLVKDVVLEVALLIFQSKSLLFCLSFCGTFSDYFYDSIKLHAVYVAVTFIPMVFNE